MYKNRQLMRLNKVLHKGAIKTVDCIAPGHVSFIEDRKGNDVFGEWVDLDDVEFIPLTEEWLIKMGFKHVNTLHDSTKVFEGEPFLYYKDGYARISIHTPDILYVHQLQNLYFALTGQEISIKNKTR